MSRATVLLSVYILSHVAFITTFAGFAHADVSIGPTERIAQDLRQALHAEKDTAVLTSISSAAAATNVARFTLIADVIQTNNISVARLVISDRTLGLKLFDEAQIWTEGHNADVVRNMVARFQQVRGKITRSDCWIVAVPPFESRDLSFDWAFLQRSIAVMIEHALLGYNNVMAIAWEDAPLLGAGKPSEGAVSYPGLAFLEGRYKTSISNGNFSIHVDLEMRRGGKTLSKETVDASSLPELPVRLAVAACRMVANERVLSGQAEDTATACHDLLERADLSHQLGDWGLAYALSECVAMLCPAEIWAHVRALRALSELASYNHRSGIVERDIPARFFTRRVWAGESGLRHVGPILDASDLGDEQWRVLSAIRQNTMMQFYDFTADPEDLRARFRDFCTLRAAIYQNFFASHAADPAWVTDHAAHWISEIVYFADMEALVDPSAAREQLWTALNALPDSPEATRLALRVCVRAYMFGRLTNNGAYELLLAPLDVSLRKGFRISAELARAFLAVKDRATYEQAVRQVDSVVAREHLSDGDRTAFIDLLNLGISMRSISLDPDPAKGPKEFLPTLTDISSNVSAAFGIVGLEDAEWITCDDSWDILNTDQGLHAASASGESRALATQRMIAISAADGVVWALSPDEVFAHDLRSGRTYQSHLGDLELQSLDGARICAVNGRQAYVIGYNESSRFALRTWYLRVSIPSASADSLDAKLTFEGKLQRDNDTQYTEPRMAYRPAWALHVPGHNGDDKADGYIIVGRDSFTQPVVINVSSGEVIVMPVEWPLYGQWPFFCSRAINDHGRLFILSGQLNRGKQWSAVHVSDGWDVRPTMLADFGTRGISGDQSDAPPYYRSAVMFDGILHLISRASNLAPQWTAVDTDTGATWQLATQMTGGGEAHLFMTAKWGLVLMQGGRAYQVGLPERSKWPLYPQGPQDVVHFHLVAPEAHSVCVAGEFNNWTINRTLLAKKANGAWDGILRLPRGEYAYKFVVDGNWVLDPSNPRQKVLNGYENSLLSTYSEEKKSE